jgi:hypothetical protein
MEYLLWRIISGNENTSLTSKYLILLPSFIENNTEKFEPEPHGTATLFRPVLLDVVKSLYCAAMLQNQCYTWLQFFLRTTHHNTIIS